MKRINWAMVVFLAIAAAILLFTLRLAWVHIADPFFDALDAGAEWADAVAVLIAVGIVALATGGKR